MRFAESDEQLAFAAALRELLADADVPAIARSWAAGDPVPGRKLWSRLADQGVLALATPAAYGGFGATAVDLVLAFEQLGRAAMPGPLVETIAALPRLLAGTPAAPQLADLAAGAVVATVAVPPHVPYALDAAVSDEVWLLDGSTLYAAAAGAAVRSVDPTRLLAEPVRRESVGGLTPDAVADAFELAALATAAQIHGAGRALLDRSVGYAQQRRQFGVAIGSFQAVKHQLADALVALELARPLLFAAALSLTPRDVSAAKVACSDAAYRAARTALQVHGAIGYTAEYDLSLWLTKVRALMSAWGTQAVHRRRVLAALQGGAR